MARPGMARPGKAKAMRLSVVKGGASTSKGTEWHSNGNGPERTGMDGQEPMRGKAE